MVVSSWFGDHNSLNVSSVPKDVYFDKQAADADQKKEDASRKHPKQRNDAYIVCTLHTKVKYKQYIIHVYGITCWHWMSFLCVYSSNLLEVESFPIAHNSRCTCNVKLSPYSRFIFTGHDWRNHTLRGLITQLVWGYHHTVHVSFHWVDATVSCMECGQRDTTATWMHKSICLWNSSCMGPYQCRIIVGPSCSCISWWYVCGSTQVTSNVW